MDLIGLFVALPSGGASLLARVFSSVQVIHMLLIHSCMVDVYLNDAYC